MLLCVYMNISIPTRDNACINKIIRVYSSVESDELHEKIDFFEWIVCDVLHTAADKANRRMQRTGFVVPPGWQERRQFQ